VRISPPGGKRSSACHDWLEEAAGGGPGLQARCGGRPTDFSDPDAFEREDASDDVRFYAAPRLVGHVDACAAGILREEHARRIPAGSRVLDLMSSAVSHLPGGRGLAIDGLGLNREELDANPLLRERIVHDLNRNPSIPAGDRSYGAVVCSLSWEYLTSPDRVLREAARVLAPGGLLLIGLSNRWFPPKVTRLWERLHEFERVGLVLGQVLDGGGFRSLETLSARNWPRPEDDRHAAQLRTADPVHLVAAVREG
jgi:SAM-dependent methyltransferase